MALGQSTAAFVPRMIDALSTVKHTLSRLAAGDELVPPVINLFGIAGIGKTCVLQQLFDEYTGRYDLLWLGFNLKDAPQAEPASPEAELALKLASWAEVIELLNELLDPHDRLAPQIVFDTQVSQPIDQQPDILLAHAPHDGHNRPLLLLLDSLDNLPYWKWLQERLIKPLLERDHTVIVCASQTELYWNFWELRERCEPCKLAGFAPDETLEFFKQYHAKLLAETVQKLTDGYPLVLKHFAALLALPTTTAASINNIRERLEALPDDARAIIEQIGVLRRAHVDVMQRLLGELSGEDWQTSKQHWLLHQALRESRVHGCIEPSSDTFDRFVPELRQVLRDRMAPEQYLQRCAIIADAYYKIAYKYPKTAADAMAEWLFFSSTLLIANPRLEQRTLWEAQLAKLVARLRQVAEAEQNIHIRVVMHPNQHQSGIGSKVIAWLYTDGELLQNLDQCGMLPWLYTQLKPLLDENDGDIPIRHDLRRVASAVFTELGKRIEAMWAPGMTSFETMLRAFLEEYASNEFDQAEFREVLSRNWNSLQNRPTRSLNEFIVILNSSGVLLYDRDRRVYSFNPVIMKLLSITPPVRTPPQPIDKPKLEQTART